MIKNLNLMLILTLATGMFGCTLNKTNTQDVSLTNINTKETIKIASVEEIVDELCSDKFSNRAVSESGNKIATEYIEKLFKSLNLEKVFGESYLNTFPIKISDFDTKTNENIEKDIEVSNVVGKISGKNNNRAIVITAHFDAFGRGALDNVSGVATTFEIIKNLKDKELNTDLIICMTNAEMNRFVGSRAFVNDIKGKYDKLYNINIDCVGLKDGGPLALKNISKVKDSTQLYNSIKNSFKEHNVDFSNVFSSKKVEYASSIGTGVSDYFAFEEKNYPNIHIAQSDLGSLPDKENLGAEILDLNKIKDLAIAISDWIQKGELL